MKASEIINAAIDELHGSAKLSTVLLKVKTIAFLVKNQKLKEWVSLELEGYEGVEIPSYRRLYIPPHGVLLHIYYGTNRASQDNVLIPVEYLKDEDRIVVAAKKIGNSIAEIENIAETNEAGRVYLNNYSVSFLNQKLYKGSNSEWYIYKAWQDIPAHAFSGVLLTVRTRLLDLLLELSVFDELSLVSLQQQAVDERIDKALHHISVGSGGIVNLSTGERAVQATNTGAGAQQNVASGETVNQNISPASAASLDELLGQLAHLIATEEAFAANRLEMQQQLDSIKVQLGKPAPKPGIIKRAFESLTELAADGAGAMAGHAIFEVLHKAPELFAAAGLS